MSYSNTTIPLAVQAPSPLDALLKFAQGQQAQAGIGQTQAQTGYLGAQTGLAQQQTEAAQIANQRNQMLLGLFGGAMGGGQPGAPPAGGSALPGASAAGSALPGALPPGVPPPQQVSTSGALNRGGADPVVTPMQYATAVAAAMNGGDFNGSYLKAVDVNHKIIAAALSAAGNPNDPDPAQAAQAQQRIRDAAADLQSKQLIGDRAYQALQKTPGIATAMIGAMADPNNMVNAGLERLKFGVTQTNTGQYATDTGALAGKAAVAVAGRTGETQDVTMPGPGNTKVTVKARQMPDGSWMGLNGQPLVGAIPIGGAGATTAGPAGAFNALPSAQQAMVKQVAAAHGQDPNVVAAQWNNETSGSLNPAAGDGGKSVGTLQVQQAALDDYNKAHGTNLTQDDLQASPRLGLDIGTAYRVAQTKAFDNNPVLGAMAYNWGPQKVADWRAAGANPNAVPPAVQAYVKAMYGPNAMGMAQAPPAAGPTPGVAAAGGALPAGSQVAGPGAGPAGATPAAAAAPATTGIGVSAPQWTQPQQEAITQDKALLAHDQPLVAEAQSAAMKAQGAAAVVLDLRQRAQADPAAFGTAGDWRSSIGNALQTFGPQWADNFTKWATDNKIDPSSTAGRQAMAKEFFSLVTNAEQQLGGRPGAMLTQYFSKAMPNINMQGDAVKEMLNFVLVGNQMARDYAQGAAAHFNTANANFPPPAGVDPLASRYQPLAVYDENWTAPGATSSPNVYEAASNILNGRPYDVWSKGLTRAQAADQQAEALRIALRADPSFRIGAGQIPPRAAPPPATGVTQQAATP
jgi:hypothetical protein